MNEAEPELKKILAAHNMIFGNSSPDYHQSGGFGMTDHRDSVMIEKVDNSEITPLNTTYIYMVSEL